ncbi:MAG: response regulator [Desulfarculus sp.]|nr:response regulator [Desulfarculus sp.]
MTEHPSHNRLDPSSLPRPTLLVVEDDPQLMGMLQIVLEGAGFDVVLAGDGRQALDTLARAQREEVPVDLVMMDLNMPVMDGRECLRQLGHQGLRVPVLLLSGDPLDDLEEDLLGRVAGLLHKPVGLRTLLGQVRRILEQGGQVECLAPH